MAAARKRGVVLFNPSTMPVVYTEEGHQLAGVERVTVTSLDPVGERAVAVGLLVREDVDGEDSGASGTSEPSKVS